MEWETLSTPGLVNLVNQCVCTLDNSTNGGPTLPAKQNLLVSAITAKSQDIGKKR